MKKMRIAATALALAMTLSAAPAGMMFSASAAAPSAVRSQGQGPYREVAGDLNGLYFDRALMFDDSGTLVVENPVPTDRYFHLTAFPFSLNYNSNSQRDVGLGIGVTSTYTQSVVDNQDGTYTYYDKYNFSHTLYFDPYTQIAADETGEIVMGLIPSGYKITYNNEIMEFDGLYGMIYLSYYNHQDRMDAIGVYRNEDGSVDYVRAKDGTHYDFLYSTDENGVTRVSGFHYYMTLNGITNSQDITLTYSQDGRLVDVTNHFDERGYLYQFNEMNQLTNAYNKMLGGNMYFQYLTETGDIIDTFYVPAQKGRTI